MTREIKFRAWDEIKKIMHENVSFFRTGTQGNDWVVFTSDKEFHKTDERGIIFDNPYFSQQIKIMQFIGLADKNAKDIYEGDIIEIVTQSGRKEMFVVKWGVHRREMKTGFTVDIPSFAFVTKNSLGVDIATFPIVDNYLNGHDLDIISIIGNIYQTPEILEN